jgi:DNA-binding CsgD family transcriptional regulator
LALCILVGAIALRNNPRSPLHRRFALMILWLVVWVFASMGGFSARNQAEAWGWFRAAIPGFVFLHPATLHFVATLTADSPRGRRLAKLAPLAYLPSLPFLIVGFGGTLVFRDFVREGGYWVGIPDFGSLSFFLLALQYTSYYILAFALLARRMRKASPLERKQLGLVLVSILASELLFNLEPFVLPLLTGYRTPLIASLFGCIWVGGIAYAIGKYRFLSWTPDAISAVLVEGIEEKLVFFDPTGRPVIVNKAARATLGLAEGSAPRSLADIVREPELIEGDLAALAGDGDSFACRIWLQGEGRELVDARFTAFGEPGLGQAGILLIAKEVRGAKEFAQRYALGARELEAATRAVSGERAKDIASAMGIAERTVKAHLTKVYAKLGVAGKMGLVAALRDWSILPEAKAGRVALPLLRKRGR